MKNGLKNLAIHLNEIGYQNESLVAAKLFKRAQEQMMDAEMTPEMMEDVTSESKEDASSYLADTLCQAFDWVSYEEKETFIEEIKQISMRNEVSVEFLQELSSFFDAFLEL